MKQNKGSLTVEACLSLTIFLMVFMTIMFIMRIVFAYGLVQHSLNQTAKEFSTYSYYYAVSGLADINGQIHSSTQKGKESFNENVGNVVNVYNAFNDLGDGIKDGVNNVQQGDLSGTIESLQNTQKDYAAFKTALGPAKETVRSVIDDPVAAIKSVGSVLLSGANETVKTFLGGELARALMAKYISGEGYAAAQERMLNLRVVGGLDGIDFSASQFWAPGAAEDIRLVACYTINPVFPIKIVDEIHLVNQVTVRGWSGKCIFE